MIRLRVIRMRKVLLATVLAIGGLLGGCASNEEKKASLDSQPIPFGEHQVEAPIASGNISLYPITLASISAEPRMPADEIISIEDAKKNNAIDIREGGSMDNSVSVTNKGSKKILLMTGELLIGGHQDRVVAQDTLVAPGQTVDVPVFCVEKERSTGPTDVFQPALTSVPTSVKIAAIGGDQESVWGNVDGFNLSAGTLGAAKTVNQGLSAVKVKSRIDADFGPLWEKLTANPQTVGAVLVIDGKIKSLELFGDHQVFRGGMPTILRGALSESAVSLIDADRPANRAELEEFLGAAMRKLEREQVRPNGAGTISSSVMAGYMMAKKDGSHGLVHGTFINAAR